MPTIDQLAPATAASDTDELLVSQSGIARKATRAQLLAGVQPQLAVTSGTLVGRSSAGVGDPETVSIGANLTLANGTLAAVAAPYVVTQLPAGTVPAAGDHVPVGQGGGNATVTYGQFMSGLPNVPGVDASQTQVTPTGSSNSVALAEFAAGVLPLSGGSMSGALSLAADPVAPAQAATKHYVDSATAGALPVAGGSMTGSLTLSADPSAPAQAATKRYVDAGVAKALPLSGGALSGPLTLAADPAAPSQAATKHYVDIGVAAALPAAGGTMTGPLTLSADPAAALQAATKEYVDTQVATTLPVSGGALSGPLTLAADPVAAKQAATKEYTDTRVLRAGDTLTGPLQLAADPASPSQAATKNYVDSQFAAALPRAGGVLTGPLTLAADPAASAQAATKNYVDTQVAATLPRAGGTLTGPLTLAADPTAPAQAATKNYVDMHVSGSVPFTGGTLTNPLTLAADPVAPLQAATKEYVDSHVSGSMPFAGGTLTGALTLAGDPVAPLQAATKEYVDVRLLKTGDTMTGALTVTQAPNGSALPALFSASRVTGGIGDGPMLSSIANIGFAGGAPTGYVNGFFENNISSVLSGGVATDGTSANVYTNVSYLNSSALRPLGVAATAAQHVCLHSAPTRSLPPGGVPSGRQMAEMWATWWPTVDKTNLPSSIGNSVLANETDLEANNLDDANCRFGYEIGLGEAIPLSSGGYPTEWGYGISTTTSATAQFKWIMALSGNYSIAVIDTRNAFPNGTAAGPPPQVTTALAAPSKTIAVNNVLPFTSAGVYGQPVSPTNPSYIKVGSNTYAQVGFTMSAGTLAGTLTFASAISVADGALGSTVLNASRTIWLANGQQIAFDYAGGISLFYDGSVSALHLTANMQIDDSLVVGSNAVVGGTGQFAGAIFANHGLSVSGAPLTLPNYTVALLPAASSGALVYAINGRKPGEAAGAGSGVLVVGNGVGQWISVTSGAVVTS